MAKKSQTHKKLAKRQKVLLIIGSIVVVLVVGVIIGLNILNRLAHNIPEYDAAVSRCGADNVIVGLVSFNKVDKFYFPHGDEANGNPYAGGHYFCSNQEAEDAGYEKYILSE